MRDREQEEEKKCKNLSSKFIEIQRCSKTVRFGSLQFYKNYQRYSRIKRITVGKSGKSGIWWKDKIMWESIEKRNSGFHSARDPRSERWK